MVRQLVLLKYSLLLTIPLDAILFVYCVLSMDLPPILFLSPPSEQFSLIILFLLGSGYKFIWPIRTALTVSVSIYPRFQVVRSVRLRSLCQKRSSCDSFSCIGGVGAC